MRAKNVGKKIVEKKFGKLFLYSHQYRDQKMGGGKTRETIFPETHEWCEQKMLGKNRRKKVRKNVFYIHTNIVTKMAQDFIFGVLAF